jgi:hypothetical protein
MITIKVSTSVSCAASFSNHHRAGHTRVHYVFSERSASEDVKVTSLCPGGGVRNDQRNEHECPT